MSALSWKFVAVILCAYIIVAYARPQAPEQPEPVIFYCNTFINWMLMEIFKELNLKKRNFNNDFETM